MTTIEQLAEQHMRENQARLQHVDDLMDRAEKVSAGSSDSSTHETLAELKQDRDKFASYVQSLEEKSSEEMMKSEGPMVLWQLVAQKLEKLIQRLEK